MFLRFGSTTPPDFRSVTSAEFKEKDAARQDADTNLVKVSEMRKSLVSICKEVWLSPVALGAHASDLCMLSKLCSFNAKRKKLSCFSSALRSWYACLMGFLLCPCVVLL